MGFWLAYLPCALFALLLNPTLDQLVFGRGRWGNPVLVFLHLAAFVITTVAVALPGMSRVRRSRWSVALGALIGLVSQSLTYVGAFVFDIFLKVI